MIAEPKSYRPSARAIRKAPRNPEPDVRLLEVVCAVIAVASWVYVFCVAAQ